MLKWFSLHLKLLPFDLFSPWFTANTFDNAATSYIPRYLGQNQVICLAGRRPTKRMFALLSVHFRSFFIFQYVFYVWDDSRHGRTNTHRLSDFVFRKCKHYRCSGLAVVHTVHVSFYWCDCVWVYCRQVKQDDLVLLYIALNGSGTFQHVRMRINEW